MPDLSSGRTLDEIRNNLRDRYRSRLSVLKELLQNADDAGGIDPQANATQFVLCLNQTGLPTARHPLLRGPALLVFNDGLLREDDAANIASMGRSSKAADGATIGRFGLGLKSVFRLCEAFFYFSSSQFENSEPRNHLRSMPAGFLNPWAPFAAKGRHPDWEDHWANHADADLELLREMRRELFPLENGRQWLGLWIPLRQSGEGGDNVIYKEFCGHPGVTLDEVFGANWRDRLLEVLPLLRRVRSLEFKEQRDGRWHTLGKWTIESECCVRFPKMNRSTSREPVMGTIRIQEEDKSEKRADFFGFEIYSNQPALQQLEASDKRPPQIQDDGSDGKVKAFPHGAAVFLRRAACNEAALHISHAVFIPLSEGDAISSNGESNLVTLPGDESFTLLLHGFYFVDAGRNKLAALSEHATGTEGDIQDEREFIARWNRTLLEEATWPLILPAFSEFTARLKLCAGHVRELVKSMTKTAEISHNQKEICRYNQLAYCMTDAGGNWCLLDANDEVYALPPLGQLEIGELRTLFPCLSDVAHSVHLTLRDWPCLGRKPALRCTEKLTARILQTTSASTIFRQPERIRYLLKLLRSCEGETFKSVSICREIRRLAREHFVSAHEAVSEEVHGLIKELLALLPVEQIIGLDLPDTDAGRLFLRRLSELELPVLLAPRHALADDVVESTAGKLSWPDGHRLLVALAAVPVGAEIKNDFDRQRSDLTREILRAAERPLAWPDDVRDLHLFLGWNGKRSATQVFTLRELEDVQGKGTLFTGAANSDSLARKLQLCLSDAMIVLLPKDIAELLFPNVPQRCDAKSCQTVLETKPALSQTRQALLSELLEAFPLNLSRPSWRCFRYLLHGSVSHFEDDRPLLARAEGHDAGAMQRLTELVLHETSSEWRLIPSSLLHELSGSERERLGIEAIEPSIVAQLVNEAEPANLDCSAFSTSDKEALLLSLDCEVLRRLNLHEDVAGNFVAVDERAYLENRTFNLPATFVLARPIRLIKRQTNPVLAARQELLGLRPLGRRSVIELALAEPHADHHWRTILDALWGEGDELKDIPPELRERAWLPTANGHVVAPNQLLYLSGVETLASPTLASLKAECVDPLSLLDEVRKHPGFGTFTRAVLPSPKEAMQRLAGLIHKCPAYQLGLSDEWTDTNTTDWMNVLGSSVPAVFPPAALIAAFWRSNEFKPHLRELLLSLNGRLSPQRLIVVLNQLVSIHNEAEHEQQQRIERVFDRYLEAAAVEPEFYEQILPHIQLRNRAGSWKSAQNLTLEENGVREDFTLSNQHAEILQHRLHRREVAQPMQQVTDGFETEGSLADTLCSYFASWEGRLPRQVIGAFLALLGPRATTVAEQNLHPRRRDDILDKIQSSYPANLAWLLRERTLQTRWVMGVSRGDRIQVDSLISKRISVSRSRKLQTLLAESRISTFIANPPPNVNGLMLLEIRPGDFEQEELARLLEETTRVVLHHVYRMPGTNLHPLWEELTNSQGLDIDKAQYYLLNSALTILQQAGVASRGLLKEILRRWDDALHREAEERRGIVDDLRRAPRDKEKIKDDIRTLLETDALVQESILDALRRRIREHYHYSLDSIPFELWQNADDACVQLAKLSPDLAAAATEFVVRQSADALHFIHWGRLINQTRGTSRMDGRDWEFHRDLEKMLVFSISNKDDLAEQGQQLTGKFGLGFKSVLLACARPRVLSGDLAFDVVGGIYPLPLPNEQRASLKTMLPAARQNGTIFELTLDPPVSAIEVLARFRQTLPCLLVFAHHLHEAIVIEGDDERTHLCWKPEQVVGVKDTVWGRFPEPLGEAQTALVFRVPTERGPVSLLLGLCPSGFVALPDFVSGFWITTPTQESGEFGFAINGPLDPDVGRSRLAANSSRNENLANLLASALADRFTKLHQTLRTTGDSLKAAWNVSADDYAFWHSFWQVLGVRFARLRMEGPAGYLARLALWNSAASGMQKFLTDCAALPTELFGDYRRLTRLSDVRFLARGCFQEQTIFEVASGWPEFRGQVQPGHIISEKEVGRFLKDLATLPATTQPISLAQALDWELGETRKLTAEQAARIGVLLNKEFFGASEATGMSRISVEEAKDLEGRLTSALFQAEDDNWHTARELLNVRSLVNSDESLRAAFAPPNRRLSEAYTGTAIALFEKCHEYFTAGGPAELADWALASLSDFRRNAVLRYLLKGELRDRLARELQPKLADSWLTRLDECEVFRALAPEDQLEIRDMLRLHRMPPPSVEFVTRDPSAVLEQIYDWWMHEADRDHLIRSYERRLYPRGQRPQLDPDPERLRNNTAVRKEWLTLWLLGAFHTMGRTIDQQHRSFLELCENHGWLEVFANPHSTQPAVRTDELLKVLDHYFEDHGQWLPFYHWFRQFVTIYKVARWLPEYVEAYLEVERSKEPFSLSQIENPRMLAGFDAPPNNQAIGLGSYFIMREMVRFGMIRNPLTFEHCYVPLGRVSRLWVQIGSGGGIYQGLCAHLGKQRATFDGAFDLPLLFVAENIQLQERFLNSPLPPPTEGEPALDEI